MALQISKSSIAAYLLLGVLPFSAQAALIDRGSGLIYDDVLDVTWLQDANYSKTSGDDADGKMSWADANTWAANLVYHDSVRNVDYSDWRLPAITPIDGSTSNFNYTYASNGSTDNGFGITSQNSELGYMYYVNLNLVGAFAPDGSLTSNYGIFGTGTTGGQNNVGLIQDLQGYAYWSESAYPANADYAWWVNFGLGRQGGYFKTSEYHAWAVRDGDVAAVPVPEAAWLFGSGLIWLSGIRRTIHS